MKEDFAKKLVNLVINEMIYVKPDFNREDIQKRCIEIINTSLDKVKFISHFQFQNLDESK